MKKIFSLLLLLVLCISAPLQGFAVSTTDKSRLTKNVIISKAGLERSLVKWTKYRKAVDKLIEEKKNDKIYLENLVSKLEEKRSEFAPYVATERYQKIIFLIDYITSKAELALFNLENSITEPVNINVEKIELDENDKNEVKKRMLSLQSNMLESSEDIFVLLKKYTSYKQSGSYEMSFNMDEDSFGTLMSELKIKDYVSKNNLFDSSLRWDIEWRLEYSIAGQDLKVEFSSFVDAIVKDNDFYVLLDDVKSTIESENNELKSLIDISNKISTEGKYVRFKSDNLGDVEVSKELIDNFLSVNKYRSLLENPILEAYKVEWDRYYLAPTETFCDEAKKLFGWVLGNLGDGNCSESQYNDMVEEFIESTNAYMTIEGDISTIYMEERWGISKMNMSFNDNEILSANMEIIDNSPYSGESKMTMSYVNSQNLDIIISSPSVNASFISKLNDDNSFLSFDMIMTMWDILEMNMTLLNNNIVWSMQVSIEWQDMVTADLFWKLEKDYLDMKVIFEFMDFIKRSEDSYKGRLEIWADTRSNKNNFDMSLLINQSDKNIVELDIISESTIEYWEVEIEAPTDFVEAEEVWSEEDFEELY